MPTAATTTDLQQPRKRWRFSLRTLFIAMSAAAVLLASLIAPMLHEVRRATAVSQQLGELREAGFGWETRRLPDSLATSVAARLWPWKISTLGSEISVLQINLKQNCDLAELPRIATVTEVRVGYATVHSADKGLQFPGIRRVTYEQANTLNPPLDPDVYLLTHFPDVEDVSIVHVPADSLVLRDLQGCRSLRRLELCLDGRWITTNEGTKEDPFNSEPLRNLRTLEMLNIHHLPQRVDWSFLADMTSLRNAEINPHNVYVNGNIFKGNEHWQVATREETPLFHLARLPQLQTLRLESTPAYAADLEILAKHTIIETLRLEHLPEGPHALASLRGASSLRNLHLKLGQFSDLVAVRAELEQLTQVRELSCEFTDFSLPHAELLASLSQLETLRITHITEYQAGETGRKLLADLPLVEFYAGNERPVPGMFANDVEKLTLQAAKAYRQRLRELPNSNQSE